MINVAFLKQKGVSVTHKELILCFCLLYALFLIGIEIAEWIVIKMWLKFKKI